MDASNPAARTKPVTQTTFPHLVIATLTESIGPIERGERYADPLGRELQAAGLGDVTGGGTQLDAAREVAFVDLELALADLEGALTLVRSTLVRLGAPRGSVLSFTRDGALTILSIETGEPAELPTVASGSTGAGDAAFSYDPQVVSDLARKILANYRQLLVDSYPLGPIDPAAYPAETFAWYDEQGAALTAIGFRALGDLKIVKQRGKPEPGAGPFARRFLSPDGTCRVDIFQLKGPNGWVRVVNAMTELGDGLVAWTTTAEQKWITPPHVRQQLIPPGTPADRAIAMHTTHVDTVRRAMPDATPTTMTTLEDVLALEDRCQARTAAFRRAQGVPAVDELIRLGSERSLARLVHEAMRREVFGGDPSPAPASSWHIATVDMAPRGGGVMSLATLIEFALDQGVTQVEQAGSPLNPFLIYDTGRTTFFVSEQGESDPLEIALQTLRETGANVTACALVVDSRITMRDGKTTDAIVVMASVRGATEGELWAQGYRPKGFLRSFKRLPLREQVGTTKNLFAEAAAAPADSR